VGPELIAEAYVRRLEEKLPHFFLCGGEGAVAEAGAARGHRIPIIYLDRPPVTFEDFQLGLPSVGDFNAGYHPGLPDETSAEIAFESLKLATRLAVEGQAGGIVTGPISKAELAKVGFDFPGQTEFVAHACGLDPDDAVMMLAGPQLRTVPLTIHIPLVDVPTKLTHDLIVRRCRTVDTALQRDFGLPQPRLALCGLNPHAGERGRMGREEIEIIAPAIATLRAEGIDATGPHPADTLFAPHLRPTYDVAIAMYHDQALVPLKTLDFDQGVNVTLGLPIVRTSPDHGTAFDIAGKGIADPGAMIAAIRMAGEIAARRAAW
jgi:4-hydroxythreonine-4-phosphate dehydrogenase